MIEKPITPYLLGAGIVRGLTVTRQLDQNIVLESGYGYGSNGLPFFCEGATYRHYVLVNYDDLELVTMNAYFRTPLNKPIDNLQIWQLKNDSEAEVANEKVPFHLLKPQSAADTEGSLFLDDKVVVLFRSNDKMAIKVLLMRKKDVAAFSFPSTFQWNDVLLNNTDGESPFSIWGNAVVSDPSKEVTDHDLYLHLHPTLQLPVLAIRRFGYGDLKVEDLACDAVYLTNFCVTNPKIEGSNVDNPRYLKDFNSVCVEYALIIDTIRCEFEEALTAFHGYFGEILGNYAVTTLNAFWKTFEARWCAFRDVQTATDKTAMQYWYDVFADLTAAYNELRAEALRFYSQNDLNPMAFTQHLVLGSLSAEPSFAFPNPYRTGFQQAPIFNGQAEQLQRLRFLHWRLVMMMKCFYAPNFEWDDVATDSVLTPSADINTDNPEDIAVKINMPIRLTPSRHLGLPLGQRAIPYYFDLAKSEQSLHWYWDFEATQQNRATEHLSYHSENEDAFVKQKGGDYYAGTEGGAYSQVPHIVHGFAFDVRGFPFVRIEGLIGKTALTPAFSIKNAQGKEQLLIDLLKDLAKQYNICFDVKILPINALTPSVPVNGVAKGFCGKCLEHLGGVYHGGTFYIFYENYRVSSGPQQFKIVADFTALNDCDCPTISSAQPIAPPPIENTVDKVDNQTIIAPKTVKKKATK
jgi:hypothetical protein